MAQMKRMVNLSIAETFLVHVADVNHRSKDVLFGQGMRECVVSETLSSD